jgi:type IV pilus assembly protein PilC
VLGASYFARNNILLLILAAVAIFGLFKLWVSTERGRLIYDTVKLRLPVIGEVVKKVVVSRLARTMAVLSHSGLPIVQSLTVVSRAANNLIYERAMMEVKRLVEEGKTLAEAMQQSKIFPVLLVQMVATGEQTGTMDVMFSKVATFYEKQVKATVESIIPLIEPFLIVALGFMVGSMLVVMYLPIFKLPQVIK